ncbi:hypothetical protein [Streptomyces sp. NPDC057382]|uniref:hypothetical protein n=1 Tax=unclassified Streptomyces TaxID=2593676 RepID=UPI00363E60F0
MRRHVILTQPFLVTATQTIPIAALTTVALGAVLAPWIARRQEAGKFQAAGEATLRELLVELRADVVYARARLDARSNYDPRRFSGRRLNEFCIQAVARTRKLPKRQQRKVRKLLVELVGEWLVELAEEMGPALVREEPDLTYGDVYDRDVVTDEYKRRAEGAGGGVANVSVTGLLGAMERSALPHEDHASVIAALDRLLALVGAGSRLGQC